MKKYLKLIIGVVFVVLVGAGLWGYWKYSALYPATQDAYVDANILTIASEVTGKVADVHVAENQHVKAGDPLFDLDPTIYQNTLTEAQANVESAKSSVAVSQKEIAAGEAAVASAQTAKDQADTQLNRQQILFNRGDVAQTALDSARTGAAQAKAALDAANAQLSQAKTGLQTNQDNLASAQARLATAQTNLAYTKVVAPADGWIANLTLLKGSPVTAYAPLFSLVESSDWWVDANFKETDLPRIKDGQPVNVSVDMLPGVKLSGKVVSLARGSGATFALLPPENASGNWVKVIRRFAVRIKLDPTDADLRVGASATARVDTTAKPDTTESASK